MNNKEVMTVSRKLNKRPQPKLSILNPFTQSLANNTVTVLITNKNNPKVKMVSGKVKSIRNGFRNALSIARTNANNIAVP